MRLGLLILVACGDGGETGDGGPGDADTDVDTDADTDADTDTDPATLFDELTCLDAPCDADPVGTWSALGQCFDDPRFAEIESRCDGIELTVYGLAADGNLTFDATTYTWQVYGGSTGIAIVVPPSCNVGCLSYQIPDLGVECTTTGEGGCDCSGAPGLASWIDNGTWTRDGGTLTLVSDATGGTRSVDLCVTSEEIWLYDPNRDLAIGGVAVIY